MLLLQNPAYYSVAVCYSLTVYMSSKETLADGSFKIAQHLDGLHACYKPTTRTYSRLFLLLQGITLAPLNNKDSHRLLDSHDGRHPAINIWRKKRL